MPDASALDVMREYLSTVKGLLAGDEVTHDGSAVKLHRVTLGIVPPPRTPVFLGALGPKMLGLAGELADGAALNWCTPEHIAWSRERVGDGSRSVGRDPADVRLAAYIRVCVDDDVDAARRAFARAMLGYALGPPRASERGRALGYRAHFERMGYAEALAEMDRMVDGGASPDQLADAFPPELLSSVGYYGDAAGAANAFRRLAEGLDIAIVRVVAARPGADGVLVHHGRLCAAELGHETLARTVQSGQV